MGMTAAERQRRWRETHQEQVKAKRRTKKMRAYNAAKMREWRTKNLEKVRARERAYYAAVKQEMLAAYGGRCECCGETEPVFLCIDHVGGGGRQHRQYLHKETARFWSWLKRQGFPPGFRLLCFNCNCATRWGRICPHQLRREVTA